MQGLQMNFMVVGFACPVSEGASKPCSTELVTVWQPIL